MITDLFIGFHSITLFTWGSIALIGLITKYFLNSKYHRYVGVLGSTMIFFILSNFGVWFASYFHGINNLSLIEKFCMIFLPVMLGFIFYMMCDIIYADMVWWLRLIISVSGVALCIGLITGIVNFFSERY